MPRIIVTILRLFFRLRMKTRPLQSGDRDAAAKLLADQFAYREPLTRQLGLSSSELLPLISAHIDHCAAGNLGVVALRRDGVMLGVITAEDDYRPFVPPEQLLTPRLRMVGEVLGRVNLPPAWSPDSEGELFYCDLAATDPKIADKHVLAALTLGIFDHMTARGFKRGYAKVTNPRMIERLRGFERLLGCPIFTVICSYRDPVGNVVTAVGWSLDFLAGFFRHINFSWRLPARVSFTTLRESKR